MSEQEITQTYFSENWVLEQVGKYQQDGWAFVPDLVRQLAPKHRRNAFNAIKIAHTLLLIELVPAEQGRTQCIAQLGGQLLLPDDERAMCPHRSDGTPLCWARVAHR